MSENTVDMFGRSLTDSFPKEEYLMSNTMEDVRRFAGADQGLSVASFGRPDQSVHSTVVSAGVMDHPVTGERVVALVVRGNTVKLRHWRCTPSATIVFRSGQK